MELKLKDAHLSRLLSKIQSNSGVLLGGFFVLLNLALKSHQLYDAPISGDEPFSIFYAQFHIYTILDVFLEGNNAPLFEIILHYWVSLFGIGQNWVRLLPIIFSSLTVYYIYKISTKSYNERVAVVASLFFTFSNYEMYFSHEVRAYSLFMLLTTASFYFFISLTINHKSRFYFFLLISTNILLLYTHYLSFFVVFSQLLSTIIVKRIRQQLLKKYLLVCGITICFYIPMISVFITRFFDSVNNGTWISRVTNMGQLHDVFFKLFNSSNLNMIVFSIVIWLLLQKYFTKRFEKNYLQWFFTYISIFFLMFSLSIYISPSTMIGFWKFTGKEVSVAIYLVFILILIISALLSNKISSHSKQILFWIVPLFIMFISSFWIPMFIDRYWIFVTPAIYILLAMSLDYLLKDFKIHLPLLMIIMMFLNFSTKVDKGRENQQLVKAIQKVKNDSTTIYFFPNYFDLAFTYYYNQDYFKDINEENPKKNLLSHLASENIFPLGFHPDLSKSNQSNSVIFIDASGDLYNEIKKSIITNLKSKFQVCDTVNYKLYKETDEFFKIYRFTKK